MIFGTGCSRVRFPAVVGTIWLQYGPSGCRDYFRAGPGGGAAWDGRGGGRLGGGGVSLGRFRPATDIAPPSPAYDINPQILHFLMGRPVLPPSQGGGDAYALFLYGGAFQPVGIPGRYAPTRTRGTWSAGWRRRGFGLRRRGAPPSL